jgi:hypothetical protein
MPKWRSARDDDFVQPQPSGSPVARQRFSATLAPAGRGGVFVPVPFDPDRVWQPKPRHHVTGTINGVGIRAVIETIGTRRGFTLGPAWVRDCRLVAVGDTVTVEVIPEGPQRGDLADDVAAALDAHPEAAAFFDSLAQFYRKAYLRWVDATKRSPELRAERIAEMIRLLAAGVKQRPQS